MLLYPPFETIYKLRFITLSIYYFSHTSDTLKIYCTTCMTCSNYYLIVLTWNLSPIHPAVCLQDIWLPISYNGTSILILYEIQMYLYFIKSYNFFYNIFTGYYYNRSQQSHIVSNNSRQTSIYHLGRSHNQYVNHIVLFMLCYNTCSIICKHNYIIRTILLVITQKLLSHVIRCRILAFILHA